MMSGRNNILSSMCIFSACVLFCLIATGLQSAPLDDGSRLTIAPISPVKLKVTQGGEAVRAPAFRLMNTGESTQEWTASANQGWLRFEPASGTLAPHQTAAVEA